MFTVDQISSLFSVSETLLPSLLLSPSCWEDLGKASRNRLCFLPVEGGTNASEVDVIGVLLIALLKLLEICKKLPGDIAWTDGELKLNDGRKFKPNEKEGVRIFRFTLPKFDVLDSLALALGVSGGIRILGRFGIANCCWFILLEE